MAKPKPPNPSPQALSIHQGSARRPISNPAPTEKRARPKMPRGLDPVAKAEWQRVCGALESLSLVADAAVVEHHVRVYSKYRQADERLKADGLTVAGDRGGMRMNPWWHVWRDCSAALTRSCAALGLTPLGRRRLGLDRRPAPTIAVAKRTRG